jgi:integrase/recombinase XerD
MAGRIWAPTVSGPLAPYVAEYRQWLVARGLGGRGIPKRVWQLGLISRWLEREGLSADRLTPERLEQFVAAHRAAGYATWISRLSTRLPVEFLREVGVVPPTAQRGADGPVERLLADYRRYLAHERGLARRTIDEYERVARLFLEDRERADGPELEKLSAADVTGFLVRECSKRSVAGARKLVSLLRSLLRYLHVAGLISMPLRWAVPGVADLRDRSLPRGLEPTVVKKLLESCDRRRTVGRRDYAILLLLVRLGLRAGEVAALTLDDIDWRRGEIVVRGKGGRFDRLSLSADVGRALASYLRRRSSKERSRAVFLKVQAPDGALNSDGVKGVVRKACRRAQVESVGPHRLRHTAATNMLREGASLPEIAQVLRHRELRTTAQYAKVDRARLRALALPWPGGAT